MDNREQILKNRERIREAMKLNITKKASNQSKLSTEPSEKANSPEFFDHVLNQKCEISDSFEELFEIHEKIGEGAQSVVRRVIEKKTGQQFACKIIGNSDAQKIVNLKRQYKLLKALDINSVIKPYYLFISEKESTCRVVLQLCKWPTLRELLNQMRFSEESAAELAKTLLQTVVYLHSRGVCHRDIKPQNILYNIIGGELKLIDFEVSALTKPGNEEMWTVTGSLFYKAPEMFSGAYTKKIDVWAVGVVVFQLLHGHPPFQKEYVQNTIHEICNVEAREYIREDLQPFTQDFLFRCLCKNPLGRFTASQALKSPFILRAANKSVTPRFEESALFEEKADPNSPWTGNILKRISLAKVEMRQKSHSSVFDADFGIRLESKHSQQ